MSCVKPLGSDVGAGPMFADRISGAAEISAIGTVPYLAGFSYRSRVRRLLVIEL
jgi:hypothetical protein